MKIVALSIILHCVIFITPSIAQQADSAATVPPSSIKTKKKIYHTGLFKATAVPVLLIGYGLSTFRDHGIYSSYDLYRDVKKLNFKRTSIDDYLQYAPYAELLILNLIKIKCKNDFLNTGLLILKSQLLMTAIVFPLKNVTHITRPDSLNPARDRSFPSGHTANAFVAASIVHKEFKDRSPWYGVGAYTIAASVGVFRMLNNRHWQSDVFVGAGIGMLSVHLVYLTHQYRWGRNTCLLPTYQNGNLGFVCYKQF